MNHINMRFVMTAVALFSAGAHATIIAQSGPQFFATTTASENFASFVVGTDPGNPFSSGGFTFALPVAGGEFLISPANPTSGFTTQHVYDPGGASTMLRISLTGGADFQQIQFDVSDVFSRPSPNLNFVWLRAYNNGAPAGFDFDFDLPKPSTLSVWTDGASQFDEIRVGAYGNAANRNAHNESLFSAIAFDNVIAGTRLGDVTNVPEPTTLALLVAGLAGLGALRRRKAKTRNASS